MVSVEYANAYSEVLEILKYISKEDYEKIPNSKIELFETNHNKEYIFKYNPNKTLDEQDVSKIAKAIIAILFRDYWATEIQKEKIENRGGRQTQSRQVHQNVRQRQIVPHRQRAFPDAPQAQGKALRGGPPQDDRP